MKVCAVVVTYNRLKLLKECISNLLKQSYRLSNIIVINNNSTDGTGFYLKDLHKRNNKVIVRTLKKNIGGAGGFSIGVLLACQQCNPDYIWIMDDDTMPTKDSLQNLLISAKNLKNNFGFLCSNVRWWGNREPCNIPHVSKDWTKLANKSLVKVITATFVSVLIPRKNVENLGAPIKQMFIWGDDTEYTTRLSKYYDSYFVPNSIVLHKSASNKSYETIFNVSINRMNFYKCMYRNIIFIDKKYYSFGQLMKDLLSFIYIILRIPFISNDKRIKRMLIVIIGIFNGILFNPTIQFPKNNNK